MTIIASSIVAVMNAVEPVTIYVRDADGNPVAASNLKLTVFDMGGNVFVDSFTASTRITNPTLGVYQFPLGGDPTGKETMQAQRLIFFWQADGQPNTTQRVAVVSIMTMDMMGRLQEQIDKSHKDVEEDPDNPVFLGYTAANLLGYLEGGLSFINAWQPYPTWNTIDMFPTMTHGQILVYAAELVGIDSQELYAVDTDIPNFSNQGNAFVIEHYPKLEAYANKLFQYLDKLVPQMKLQYVNTGSLHIEAGPNFRLAALLAASPNGGLFRNTFTAGGGGL